MNYHRKTIRLKGYDYTQNGYYFVTICVQDRKCVLGEVVGGRIKLSRAGRMIQDVWNKIPNYYPGVAIDAFQIMPNHVHGIIVIDRNVGAGLRACPGDIHNVGAGLRACPGNVGRPRGVAPTDMSLFDVIERFKSLTTHLYIRGVHDNGWPSFNKHLWQRNYYEHIIRNDREYGAIRQYAENNAINWEKDNLFI